MSIDDIVNTFVTNLNYVIGGLLVSLVFFSRTYIYFTLSVLVPLKLFTLYDKSFRTPTQPVILSHKDVAVITGGSRGLGLEMVAQLMNTYKVGRIFVVDKIEPELEISDVTYIKCDVGDKKALVSSLEYVVKVCEAQGVHVSVFINNAGIRHHRSVLHMDDETIMNLYNVNVLSFVWGARVMISNHLARHTETPLSIVTISSVLGTLAPKNLTIYSSTKAALTQVHEGLAEELASYEHIRMLLVLPGQLSSGMFDDIKPSRLFFAPIVDHRVLATQILNKVNNGECGTLSTPLYSIFLPLIKCLPYSMVKLCRWFSEMDKKVKERQFLD